MIVILTMSSYLIGMNHVLKAGKQYYRVNTNNIILKKYGYLKLLTESYGRFSFKNVAFFTRSKYLNHPEISANITGTFKCDVKTIPMNKNNKEM